LKWVQEFRNAHGRNDFIGSKDDDGKTVGVADYKKADGRFGPTRFVDGLGIMAEVNSRQEDGLYLSKSSRRPIRFLMRGNFITTAAARPNRN